MDPLTIVIALLTAVIAVLTAPMWLGHLDTAKILGRMDRDIEWVDRSATASEHAANGARKRRLLRGRRPTETEAIVRVGDLSTCDRDLLRDALRIAKRFREIIRNRYHLGMF
jgi:hypothetical protein